ncbi:MULTISPECIES: DUF3566 domain-containing protein [unclassified Nocardioides]|uniref:DUF3566 domain-containing protein n=1 Tax=unclassified Nocardioides TaxID=2615069 RepID=UPI0007030A39|nr:MULTISPECIES: DUF3566 domain-containing protein [unclassified Nocardioides]KQP63684.1 hypothetical protein ASF47_16860 [Nocardioides sp. Leaf285]KQQ39369.1 hypothetical protein ASF50_15580 [Nocardioides sp. Leaf307]MCM3516466.1 DUF3566 domain-containing protein [Nocardioides sp. P86]
MTDRPAERGATRTDPQPGGSASGARAADDPDATATRPALTDRVQSAFSSMTQEKKAKATGTTVTPAAGGAPSRGPRRARLRLTRIDPWSVMKTSFLLAIAFAVVTVVSVLMVWSVLGAAGVWDSINETVRNMIGGQEAGDFDVENYVGTSRVLGFTMLVAAIDVVLITAVATLGAFLYNMAAALLGGIEVTLSEDN